MPTWTNPRTATANADFTVDWYNAEIRDNLLVLYRGNPFVVQTAGGTEDHYSSSAGQAVLQPVTVDHPCTIPGLIWNCNGAGSGSSSWGIYEDQGDGTGDLIEKSATYAASGGINNVPFSTPVGLEPATLYWFAYAFQNGDAEYWGTKGPVSALSRVVGGAYPLPTTITIGSTTRSTVCAIAAEATPIT